jgi:thiol-disulfide isomerase/thioredoxin
MGQAQSRKQKILGDVKKARRRRNIITIVVIAVLAVSIVAGIVLLTPHTPQDPHIGQQISTAMYDQLAGVSNSTLAAVRGGQGVASMTTINGSPLRTPDGKPEFFYVGADYCPYCAAERWPMIVALLKFGTFTVYPTYMMSSSTDVNPNTPTFSFYGSKYQSNYISFVGVETSDRDQNTLQTLTSDQQNIVNNYDCYNHQCGSLAFIDIYNKWVMNTQSSAGSQFSPSVLDGVGNWTAIGSLINNPQSAVAQAVDGAANYLIAAICDVDGGSPSSVCSHTYVTQAPIGITNVPLTDSFNTITTSDVLTVDSAWRNSPPLI